jgi:hypothetical protein
MKSLLKSTLLSVCFLIFSQTAFPQCEILNKVTPDGSMQYYMQPVNFYWTKNKSLTGCIVTDKESYFLELRPLPFPPKPEGKKLKKDLSIKLSDGKSYTLDHYDTRYVEEDTVMEILFLIKKDDIDNLLKYEVIQTSVDMGGDEGIRTYVFKLHKTALKEQLECFLKEEEESEKKK